jgi:hypothetical protein
MIEFYYKLNYSDEILEKVKSKIEEPTSWRESYGFLVKNLRLHTFNSSPLRDLIIKFSGNPIILKLEPMTWYRWHTDHKRLCAINQLMIGSGSRTYFGSPVNDDVTKIITQVEYTPGSYYLLNTRVKHTVFNDTTEERYALSIGFNNFSYNEILKYCKEHNL